MIDHVIRHCHDRKERLGAVLYCTVLLYCCLYLIEKGKGRPVDRSIEIKLVERCTAVWCTAAAVAFHSKSHSKRQIFVLVFCLVTLAPSWSSWIFRDLCLRIGPGGAVVSLATYLPTYLRVTFDWRCFRHDCCLCSGLALCSKQLSYSNTAVITNWYSSRTIFFLFFFMCVCFSGQHSFCYSYCSCACAELFTIAQHLIVDTYASSRQAAFCKKRVSPWCSNERAR